MDGKDYIPIKMYDSKKENTIEIMLTFDQVYKEWMQKILCFVKKVSIERDIYTKDILDKPEYSFFGTAEAVADQFFYFLMKDELSESNGNYALDELCKYITEKNGDIDEVEFYSNRKYMINLCTQEFNGFLIGQIYDFYISMWSCFEAAINSLCEPFEAEIKRMLDESQYTKTLKFIMNCIENKEDMTRILDILGKNKDNYMVKFPRYVSFPDKINYLFSDILKSYSRNRKNDKEALLYCGKLRNTIHNNGLNNGGAQEIKIFEHTFRLERREKVYYESFQDNMILINEIFDIYVEIMKAWNKR